MIKIHDKKVVVIKLFRWNTFQMELCIFKPNVEIETHQHIEEHIELVHIWGCAHYYRYLIASNCRVYNANILDFLRCFTIPRSYWHGAKIGRWGLITLSCQQWIHKPTSVTQDYYPYATSRTTT